ncbi:MAG: PH domain-containing protein [bacterium]|nr:PH domain-containing protein [bacterium]
MPLPLLPEEKIIHTKRRHWFVLFAQFALLAIAKVSLLGMFIVLWMFEFIEIPAVLLALVLVIVFQMLWIAAFHFLTDYLLDIWLITNKRSVRVKLHGLFHRSTTSIMHDKIQDITTKTKGFFPVVLGYGDLRVQAAGASSDFIFFDIPNPDQTKDVIYKAAAEYKRGKRGGV